MASTSCINIANRVVPHILAPTQGNDLFKEGKFEAAIEHYSAGMELDPHNAMLPANRAMALIKVERLATPTTSEHATMCLGCGVV